MTDDRGNYRLKKLKDGVQKRQMLVVVVVIIIIILIVVVIIIMTIQH
jgi:hypothetical protein